MEEADTVRALASIAHPLRLRLFRLLVVGGRTGLTPGAIAEALAVPAPTLSFHLKALTHAGLVAAERRGRYLIYHASFERMNELIAYLTANCCRGDACRVEATRRPMPALEGDRR